MMAGNPLLWGKGGGSYSPTDAAAEMGSTYTDHIPTILAGVLVVSVGVLLALDKAGFDAGVRVRGGRG